ncbi:MAG: AEC family transporter [Lachnospiraceae bacterium]|nr:AEC family transporter [Lachnospiraceae bacterium]
MILLKQMSVLFIIMIVGYICRKKDMFNDSAIKSISSLVVNVANPLLIVDAAIDAKKTLTGGDLAFTFFIAVAMNVFLLLVSRLVPLILRTKKEEEGLWRVITVFSNTGFMGFPLISAVYGPEALLHAAIFQLPFALLVYTWGISIIRGKKEKDPGESGLHKVTDTLKKLFNAGIVACIVSVVIYLMDLTPPEVLRSSIDYIANITPPLSMMVIGDSLAKTEIKSLVTDKKLLLFSFLKLIIIPVLWMLILSPLSLDANLKGTCMIMIATPVATMPVMLAKQYDADVSIPSRGVALTTILSVVTIPIISLIFSV